MFNIKSLFFKNFLYLTVLFLIIPVFINAQETSFNEALDQEIDVLNLTYEEIYELYGLEPPDLNKTPYSEYSQQELINEIYQSPLYQEMMQLYGLDEESKEYLSLETLPFKNTTPKPNQSLKLKAKSPLNSSTIHYTWYLDQKIVQEGYGLETINLTTKGVGESSNVSVTIKTDSGIERTKSITITPANVDLFWQTDTYAPAIYKGKNLNSSSNKGKIDFIAIPDFTGTDKIENPNDYIYSWLLNGSPYRSGRGMSSISLNLSEVLMKSSIQVNIKPLNSDTVLRESINFPNFIKPEILIYKTDPSYGIDYSQAINYSKEYLLNQDLLTVKAEPMFFTNFNQDDLEIDWYMNNTPIPGFKDSHKAYFSVDRGFTGKSSISVLINNRDNVREKIDSSILFSVNRENLDI